MPIEFCFIPHDYGREIDHQLLEDEDPGVLMPDFSDGEVKYVGIECNLADDGGRIEIFPDDGILSAAVIGAETGKLPEPIATIEVEKDGLRDIEIAAADETKATLRVRHVRPDEVTRALSVPLGLMYPDTGSSAPE